MVLPGQSLGSVVKGLYESGLIPICLSPDLTSRRRRLLSTAEEFIVHRLLLEVSNAAKIDDWIA